MTLSIFLAKLLGLYMIIAGLAFTFKWKEMMPAMSELFRNRAFFYILVIMELIGGLALVISHNIWTFDYRIIITIVGWLSLIEATAYLFFPIEKTQKFIAKFNTKNWYVYGGIIPALIGIYLVYVGFGFN